MEEKNSYRRSWMILPAHKTEEMAGYQDLKPDVLVIDLEYSVSPKYKETTRNNLDRIIKETSKSQIENFIRINRETRWADAKAAVHRNIKGIIIPGPEEPQEVIELADTITTAEKERGIDLGITEMVLMCESAKGFWNIASLAQASPRVTALAVGRIDLTMRLGPIPQGEFRFYRYLMTRTLVAARMLNKQPLGAFWKPGSRGGVASGEDTLRAAIDARNLGFTGCLCATPEQVTPVNQGFTFA